LSFDGVLVGVLSRVVSLAFEYARARRRPEGGKKDPEPWSEGKRQKTK